MYKIPLFDLNYDGKEEEAIIDVIKSGWISSGPQCMELENKIQDMFNVRYSLATANCTAALHLAMLVAGLGEGDEVIVPSLTFVATVNAIRYVGAVPKFCDIVSLQNPVIDCLAAKNLITAKTKAIVVMHYGGFACDMDTVMEMAASYGLKVIEDACHGPLSEYKGRKLGTIGDVGCFSFFSNKNVSAGEGGALVTNDGQIYNKAKLLRSHGMTSMSYDRSVGHAVEYDVVELGFNYRMDDLRASLAITQFNKLPADIKKREMARKQYLDRLSGINGLILPFSEYGEVSSSYIFPVVLADEPKEATDDGPGKRDRLRACLAEAGIQTSVHYPAVHKFRIYKEFNNSALPMTEYYSNHEISLPMYGKLKNDEIEFICTKLIQALKKVNQE